jgi:hypothetical protein
VAIVIPALHDATRQVDEARGHTWMLGAKGLFHDWQRPLVERLGLAVFAQGSIDFRQVVEKAGSERIIRAKLLLAYPTPEVDW